MCTVCDRPPVCKQMRRAFYTSSAVAARGSARPMVRSRVSWAGPLRALAYLVYSGTHVHNRLVFLNDASQVENAISEMRHC